MGAEQERVKGFGGPAVEGSDANDWYSWGPYLSERQWGTVREDYSADGEAWNYLPHDHARSRAYRWGEDGLAGFSDREQRLCLSLALWNGHDPILKERPFGLTGAEANHGEDVKDYWWYLDAVPSHAWNRWRYHYPQAAFPYEDLRAENSRRGKNDPEYELLDTGAFDDDRYWIVEVHYAKADPTDLLMSIHITNAGPAADTVHVLPTLWFRDTWSWDLGAPTPQLAATAEDSVAVPHPLFGDLELVVASGPDGTAPALLFCDNETNAPAPLRDLPDHLVPQGRDQRSRRLGCGDGEPRPAGHQVRRVVPGGGRAGRKRGAPAAAASHRGGPGRRGRAGIRFRTGHDDPAGRGRRVLHGAHPVRRLG